MPTNKTIYGSEPWFICDESISGDDVALSIDPAGQIIKRLYPLDILKKETNGYTTTLTPSSGGIWYQGNNVSSLSLTNGGDCISIRSDGTDIYII